MSMPPIIVTGMHRAGTRVLALLAEKMGIFMGEKKQEDNESVFFLFLNEWLLKQANATWDNPYNLKFIDSQLTEGMVTAVDYFLGSMHRMLYLGQKRGQTYGNIGMLEEPWGWKDPRNILLIDIWKKVFPKARILNIHRNPLDVANSLRNRKLQYDDAVRAVLSAGNIGKYLSQQHRLQLSARVGNIREGIKLWEEYAILSLEAEDKYSEDMLSIRFEDLLADPHSTISRIAGFLDIYIDGNMIEDCSRLLVGSRKFAFNRNAELVNLYNELKNEQIMIRLGYSNIDSIDCWQNKTHNE